MIAFARFAVLYYRYNDNLPLPGFLTHGIQTPLTQFGRSICRCWIFGWMYLSYTPYKLSSYHDKVAIIPFVRNLRMFLKPIRGNFIQRRGELSCWNNRSLLDSMESMYGYKSSTSRVLQRKKINCDNDFFLGWIIFQPPSVEEENKSIKILIQTTRGVINQFFFYMVVFFFITFLLYLFSK